MTWVRSVEACAVDRVSTKDLSADAAAPFGAPSAARPLATHEERKEACPCPDVHSRPPARVATDLEKHYETFSKCSVDELIKHGLKALR